LDHREGDTVLNRIGRVVGFEFGDYFDVRARGDSVQADKRGVANELEDICGNFWRTECRINLCFKRVLRGRGEEGALLWLGSYTKILR